MDGVHPYHDPLLLQDFEKFLDEFEFDLDCVDGALCPSTANVVGFQDASIVVQTSLSDKGNQINKASATKVSKRKLKSSSVVKSSKMASSDVMVIKDRRVTDEPPLKWRSFPSFDRSDSTIYFATSFARMTNNGDAVGLNRLITTHFAKGSEVVLREGEGGFRVPLSMYMDMLGIRNVLHPDAMYCMHSTRVEGNKIYAVLYGKHTDEPEMYKYRSTVVDPKYGWIFLGSRKNLLRKQLHNISDAKWDAINRLIDMNVAFDIYSKVDIILTLHDRTKKVVNCSFLSTNTSACYQGVHYSLTASD